MDLITNSIGGHQIAFPASGAAFTVLDPKADLGQFLLAELVDALQVTILLFRPLTDPKPARGGSATVQRHDPAAKLRRSYLFMCRFRLFRGAKFTGFIEPAGSGRACSKAHLFEVSIKIFKQCGYELPADAKAAMARVNIDVPEAPNMIFLCIGVTIQATDGNKDFSVEDAQ